MTDFDVVIIGAGTGGQTAAYDVSQKGLKAAVVGESDRPGGTCALSGCQPKKWFYEATEAIAKFRHLEGKGLTGAPNGEWSSIRARKDDFTSRVPRWTVDGFKEEGIEFIPGTARFRDKDTLDVDGEPIHAGYFILATEARPMTLPIDGSDHMVTSDAFLELAHLPDRILFIGGGFVSFEFAHFAARLGAGKSRTNIFEIADRPLGPFDSDMVDLLVQASIEENISVHTGVEVASIDRHDDGFTVANRSGAAFETDLVVHGAGRIPNVEKLNLDAAGIRFSSKGIIVDDTMKQAMINGTGADRLCWQNIMSPYPSRESDLIYMLEPFADQA